jgi:hypothetical protein
MKYVACILAILVAIPAPADEGLWLFNQFPKDTVQEKRGFTMTPEFLDHLRLGSVKIGGGAGAFVSANGLLVTNQHLIAACVPDVNNGFLASSEAGEVPCAGLNASVLMSTEDVTAKIKAAGQMAARSAAISGMERECAAKTGNVCSVVKLFAGGRYDLYQYKNYTDIRLVFAPERALAFFGRERDSITYLRYGLDVAFLRAYENGKPASPAYFFKWNADALKEGDLVFSVGDPGATARATPSCRLSWGGWGPESRN